MGETWTLRNCGVRTGEPALRRPPCIATEIRARNIKRYSRGDGEPVAVYQVQSRGGSSPSVTENTKFLLHVIEV